MIIITRKRNKYKDLEIEEGKLWHMKTVTHAVVIGSLGMIKKGTEKHLEQIPGSIKGKNSTCSTFFTESIAFYILYYLYFLLYLLIPIFILFDVFLFSRTFFLYKVLVYLLILVFVLT